MLPYKKNLPARSKRDKILRVEISPLNKLEAINFARVVTKTLCTENVQLLETVMLKNALLLLLFAFMTANM